MAAEYYKCKEELPITDIEKVKEEVPEIKPFSKYGNEQNTSGNEFDASPVLKEEIVEQDPTKTKLFSEYGLFNGCLEKSGKEIFYDPNSSEFQVTWRNSVEDLKESKFSPTHFWENTRGWTKLFNRLQYTASTKYR
ncbi:hypothetical protein JTB14_002481 [Gonioctena quinquepunctata]|nr:hypothetical protein JTB14_002481 [Gonioctena quinquepunctata]